MKFFALIAGFAAAQTTLDAVTGGGARMSVVYAIEDGEFILTQRVRNLSGETKDRTTMG